MAIKTGRKINVLISTLLLALFLFLAFRNVNLNELAEILKSTNYLYVIIGTLFGAICGCIVRALRWGKLLEPIKSDISLKSLFSTTVIGYMVNNLIPRSGELVRPYLLGKNENVSKAAAFGTVIIERVIDTIMFLFMFGVVLLSFKRRISNAFPEIDFAVILLAVLIFLLLFWIIFTVFKTEMSLKTVKFLTKILSEKLQKKIEKIFSSLVYGFSILRKPGLLLKIAMYSVLLWIVYLVSAYVPFYSFGIFVDGNTGLLDNLWNTNLLLVLVNVSMFIPAPANTGPYHYVCKVTLVSIFSISEAKALGYATATHLMMFVIFLIVGMYYFISSNYKISELKQETI